MKNALKKLILTDTDTQPELTIPSWKDDKEFQRWSQKEQEISRQLQVAESEQRHIKEQIEEAQNAVVRAKSALILEEGTQAELEEAESNLTSLLQKEKSLVLEVKALTDAHARAQRETKEAEQEARAKAMAAVLPLYQAKVKAIRDSLHVAVQANEEAKAFEALVTQSGLTLFHGSFGSPYVINNISFPIGLKEYERSVEGLLNKKTL